MTVTQKMIYIDNWIKEGLQEYDYEKIYKYLKEIITSISCKKGWFKGQELIDFATDEAGVMFMRLIRPELYTKKKSGPDVKINKITQIKNYLDISLYGSSVNYRQKNYMMTPKDGDKYELSELDKQKRDAQFLPTYNWDNSEYRIIFEDTIRSIPKIIRNYVKINNNFYNGELLYVNIMINLISIFSDIKLYKEIEVEDILLYGLPKKEKQKITFLVRGAVREVLKEFRDLLPDVDLSLKNFYSVLYYDLRGDVDEIEEDRF